MERDHWKVVRMNLFNQNRGNTGSGRINHSQSKRSRQSLRSLGCKSPQNVKK